MDPSIFGKLNKGAKNRMELEYVLSFTLSCGVFLSQYNPFHSLSYITNTILDNCNYPFLYIVRSKDLIKVSLFTF